MRVIVKISFVTALCTALIGVPALAQDDLNIDALFDDLDMQAEEPAPEAMDEEAGSPPDDEAPLEENPDDLDLDALFDDAVEPDEGPAEPEVMPTVAEDDSDERIEEASSADPSMGVEEDPEATAPEQTGEVLADQARELSLAEELKRQAREVEGLKQLEQGYQQLQEENYSEALRSFNSAQANIPKRPANQETLNRVQRGRIEANLQLAEAAFDRDSYTEAKRSAEAVLALDPQHRRASRLLNRIERIQSRPEPEPRLVDTEEFIEEETEIEELFEDGIEYFNAGDYDNAEIFFEQVLITDPYHIPSMRFLKKIAERRYKAHSKSLKATQEDMIQRVRETWSPPIKGDLVIPENVQNRNVQTTVSDAQELEQKMQDIIIPSIEFRQANIQDVINFLVEASEIGDPEGEGVNIILNLNIPGATQDNTGGGGGGNRSFNDSGNDPFGGFDDDGFGGGFDDGGFGGGGDTGGTSMDTGGANIPTITLNLRRVKLLDAIRYITEVANLKFRIEANAVIITPANVPSGRVITRVYPVLPSFLDVIINRAESQDMGGNDRSGEFIEMGGRDTQMGRGNVKDFFAQAGIPFPSGTSITYNPAISSLIVANTQENIELFERILPQFNVIPNQVEIEARFVEVSQEDLEELGFQWFVTDDVEIATEKGPGPVATKERIQLNADPEGFTKGVRFFGLGSAGIEAASTATGGTSLLGDLLSFSGVLTNPELTVVLHALDQNGNVDVLSAPRVTTRSGVQAQMEVVQEIIYPTEFDTDVTTIEGGDDSDRQVVTVTPGSFETRETGVILNVTPTVGPDGYTIELVMAPEVAELVDWIDYGSEFEGASFRIPQPVFASRNVTTSIVVWDGQTVVMGGLITEQLITINDKIPFLGDIPLLGRLFRNEGESSSKRNLLIFVTARVVDPAGKPIRRADAVGANAGGGSGQMNNP